MLKALWTRLKKVFVKTVYVEVEVIKEVEVPVYEFGVSRELIADLEKRFPRLMYVKGNDIEDFAQNAGSWRVILHLQKQLRKQAEIPRGN